MVQSASNLLAGKQRESWTNLDALDRTRVATSLVITVEDTAFAVANTVDTQMTSDDNICKRGILLHRILFLSQDTKCRPDFEPG